MSTTNYRIVLYCIVSMIVLVLVLLVYGASLGAEK